MTTIVAFDTLKYANRLKEANVPPEQAEIQAAVMKEVLETALQSAEIATKSDLKEMQVLSNQATSTLNGELTLLRMGMEAMENRIIVKLGKMMLATVGLAAALIAVIVPLIVRYIS